MNNEVNEILWIDRQRFNGFNSPWFVAGTMEDHAGFMDDNGNFISDEVNYQFFVVDVEMATYCAHFW